MYDRIFSFYQREILLTNLQVCRKMVQLLYPGGEAEQKHLMVFRRFAGKRQPLHSGPRFDKSISRYSAGSHENGAATIHRTRDQMEVRDIPQDLQEKHRLL
ncbi:hypothetical protein PSAB_09085 [Paenibacillus sabinae T27]|uniref:Uncharacterized protein n=1 Tax=Paenibacillus sabinae T27 TaxID=1268072 RepID=X4ZYI9_9BACL|nr:hypothetical protein PSAB_09085 [Paenibacillus sabinae T27]